LWLNRIFPGHFGGHYPIFDYEILSHMGQILVPQFRRVCAGMANFSLLISHCRAVEFALLSMKRQTNSIGLSMFRQNVTELRIVTRGRGLYEFTDQITAWVEKSGLLHGLATLHVRHTSASLLIQENADPEVCHDLERFFARLAPDGDPMFQHTAEGDDDMPAHVRTALTAVNLSIPIVDGTMALGPWQGIYLWEHRNSPCRRQVVVHLMGE
jgi:secondary thiamine-phosphate synthase enzyme